MYTSSYFLLLIYVINYFILIFFISFLIGLSPLLRISFPLPFSLFLLCPLLYFLYISIFLYISLYIYILYSFISSCICPFFSIGHSALLIFSLIGYLFPSYWLFSLCSPLSPFSHTKCSCHTSKLVSLSFYLAYSSLGF